MAGGWLSGGLHGTAIARESAHVKDGGGFFMYLEFEAREDAETLSLRMI